MKIVIPGGSGQVGTLLCRSLLQSGFDVVVLSRRPRPAPWRVVAWDGRSLGAWAGEVDGADAVINLAGRSVDCRYGSRNRRAILDSRIDSTCAVSQAIRAASRPPRVWLQAGTATIYAHRFDAPNAERGGILGGMEPRAPAKWRFSTDVAKAWEWAALEAPMPATRRVILRSAMTMSPDRGGVFDRLLGLVRVGLGGAAGDGRQYVSWIHEADFVRAVHWIIGRDDFSGAVNLASPAPLPNREFMEALRGAWGIGFGLAAPAWLLEIGALVLRTETELILKSRRVVPGRLLEAGFSFEFPDWPGAARDLCERWRNRRASSDVPVGDAGPPGAVRRNTR